jgi:hypothetical protein
VRSSPPLSFDVLQGSDEAKHEESAEQNYAAQPTHEDHSLINKLVNSTPPAISAIQTRLFEFNESHCVQPNDSRSWRFEANIETLSLKFTNKVMDFWGHRAGIKLSF